jgi:hypothetical protein
MGFALPMLITTWVGSASVIAALLICRRQYLKRKYATLAPLWGLDFNHISE